MNEPPIDLSRVRERRQSVTSALLGDTITITDDEWQMPSRLPGWTRAHIATHLARQADALAKVVGQLERGEPTNLYESGDAARNDIERGSERTALELQEDLDASEGRLNDRFADLFELPPAQSVRLGPDTTVRLDHLPIVHLNHLVLHHLDLDTGYTCQAIEPEVAAWLLTYNAARIGRDPALPAIRLVPDHGAAVTIGGRRRPLVVHGADGLLLCWLTGRLPPDQVDARLPAMPIA